MQLFNLSNAQDYERAEALFVEMCKEGKFIELGVAKKKRTPAQNRAIHVLFNNLADQLNEAGLDMVAVMKHGVEIPWTGDLVKENLWKPLQQAMLQKKSTTQLTTKDIDKVFETLNRHLAEKLNIAIEFPSIETIINNQRVKENV